MNSSGIKRGLATTAVSALAVAGLPLLATPAHADPVDDQVAGVDLFSQFSTDASPRNDGTDNTIRLEAGAEEGLTHVTFFYELSSGGVRTKIATVARNDDGAFSYEWAGAIVGTQVDIIVAATNADGQLVDASGEGITYTPAGGDPVPATGTGPVQGAVDFSDAGFSDTPVSDSQDAVDITFGNTVNIASAEALGVFQSPYDGGDVESYVGVSGTTSSINPADSVAVQWWDGTAMAGTGTTNVDTLPAGSTATTGTWSHVLDITGYPYSLDGSADELVVGASMATDDVESFTLYRQTITTVTAATSNVTPDGARVTVTVLDQQGKPVAGARVVSSNAGASAPDSAITNAQGKAVFQQTDGTAYYYADATAAGGYQANLGDQRSEDVTVTQYVAAPTTLAATSRDGDAFDLNEYSAADITVQVKDQQGTNFNPAETQTLEYYWVITPFNGAAAIRVPAAPATTSAVDAADGTDDGKFQVALPAGQPAGTYDLFGALSANPGTGTGGIASSKLLTVKTGQAQIVFDDAAEVAAAGTSQEVTGRLVLEPSTANIGLAGRRVQLTYSSAGNARFVLASGATASSTTLTTGENGAFSATLRDPAVTNQPTETGEIDAATVAGTPDSDNPGATTNDHPVVFAQTAPPAGSTVTITEITGNKTPGVAVPGTVTVRNGGAAVANQLVTLTVDGASFFTNGNYDAPKKGQDVGNLVSLGQSITVVTNASGEATFQVAVERSEEFDDDGLAEDIVTAAAGTVTDTEDVDYSSASPLNGGEVQLVVSPEGEQEGPVDPAPVGNDVAFDVFTTDQFGNRIGGITVTVNEDGDDATLDGDADTATAGFQVVSDFRSEGDFSLTSTDDDEVTVTATWGNAPFTEFQDPDDDGNVLEHAVVTGTRALSDSETVKFQNVTITDETVTLTSSPEGTVPVGTAVTETVTVLDDEGNPVPGVTVRFTQAGPGTANVTVERTTNAQGQAFYVVTSAEEGNAFITAVVETSGTPVTKTDTVTFGTEGPFDVTASLRGKNNGAKADRLKVVTETDHASITAEGATVKLFKVVNKKARLVATKTINADEKAFFKVADRNGKKQTTYFAKVMKTENTKFDKSNLRRIR